MKPNTILLGITISLLLALPVSASDNTLEIFGNANENDTINMQDVTQTELIILGLEQELTLIDSGDRIVTFKKPLERIVITWPNTIEALRSLGVSKDVVVGVPTEKWLDSGFYPEFVDVAAIGGTWDPDTEAILDLNPDAVFLYWSDHASSNDALKPVQDALESVGITVFRFKFGRFDIHQKELKKLGYIVGKPDEAGEYLDWRENILNSIEERVEGIPEEDRPKVYFECTRGPYISFSLYGRYGYAAMAGGKDIFADSPNVDVDPEVVIERNPDIIVKVAWLRDVSSAYDIDVGDTTELEEIREEIMSRPELQNVKAIKEGKVYVITTPLLSYHPHSGCREFVQIAYQAKWSHPELFEDLDEKGVFVFPPFEES